MTINVGLELRSNALIRTSHKCDVKNKEDEIEFKWGVTPDLNCFFAHFEPILISI